MKYRILLLAILIATGLSGRSVWDDPIRPFGSTSRTTLLQSPYEPVFDSGTAPYPDSVSVDFALAPWSDFQAAFREYFTQNRLDTPMLGGYLRSGESLWTLRTLWGLDYESSDGLTRSFPYLGVRLQAGMGDLRVFGEAWKGHFEGDEAFILRSPILDGYWKYDPDSTVIYLDNARGFIELQKTWYRIAVGRGSFQTGDNIAGSVILNDWANDYAYLSADLALGSGVLLSTRQASLLPDSTTNHRTQERFLARHSLKVTGDRVRFEVGEQEIYGDRGFDLDYLMPQMVWRVIEHNLHDRDNAMIFLDLTGVPGVLISGAGQTTLYLNFLLDEFSSSKVFTNWWGNKWAAQTGIRQSGLSGNWDCTLEFTAVRPWTYTHYIGVNRFTHDGRPLGFPGGSNLIQYTLEVHRSLGGLLRGLSFDTWNAYRRQGSLGSDVFQNYNTRPDNTTRWLEGTITDTLINRAVLTFAFNAHHTLRAAVEAESVHGDETRFTFSGGWQTGF